jgi:hypothetical protein
MASLGVYVNQALYDELQTHAPNDVKSSVLVLDQTLIQRLRPYSFVPQEDIDALKEHVKAENKKGNIGITRATDMTTQYKVKHLNSDRVVSVYTRMMGTYFMDGSAPFNGELVAGILRTAFALRADKHHASSGNWDLIILHEKGDHSCSVTMLRIGRTLGSTRNFLFFTLGKRLVNVDLVGYYMHGRGRAWLKEVSKSQ